ncbi:radial spoke protein 17 [Volvox carteri f. nagariensis]|uniref:Radial spoke protein 17 n=1 Tax=Volvox carteri f. nagariensis TaxID=3068 RepID=D8TZF8_VOLCA|nr:radial spoke protein 17 [Volvox carteri f. nagariensis]EFJ47174.1 radial spoke protein 17 [Volvox carteri f. nagariensis]|eukprot:XP_002951723.1 radial spoke protein 17 [Volvox carteri f. nagariensis]
MASASQDAAKARPAATHGKSSGPYGTFRPATAPPSRAKGSEPLVDDPRHAEDSPMPWLRYFFPKDFDLREGEPVEPYYQFFDVMLQPLQEDTSIPPPEWAPNAYFQLSFTQLHVPKDMVLATRIPKMPPPPCGSIDLMRDNSPLLKPGNEKLMADILERTVLCVRAPPAFCRSVTTFRARTWKDAMPLVDLLRGVLLHLLNHYTLGAVLLKEQAKKDAEAALASEKNALKAWYAKQLEENMSKARAEYEEKLEAQKEQLRMTLAEDLTLQLRAEREEKNQLRQQAQQLEAQLRKLQEASSTLQRQIEHGQQQIDLEARRRQEALSARDAQISALHEQQASLRRRLSAAQAAVVDALNAKTKEDAMNVAITALSGSLPKGTAVYVAELRTAADVENDDPAAPLVAQVAAAVTTDEDGESEGAPASLPRALQIMRDVTPGFMTSPLAAVVGGAAAAAGVKPSSSSRPPSAVLVAALSEIKETLVFKYIKASHGQEFMLGQKLAYGSGVSWRLVERGVELHVPDVSQQPGVWFFRTLDKPKGGAYLAAPIVGNSGEVMGMLCADTICAAEAEAEAAAAAAGATVGSPAGDAAASAASASAVSDMAFVRGLAAAIGARARRDADAYAEAMLAMALEGDDSVVPEPPPAPLDPQQFVPGEGISGGLKLFSEALAMLRRLTDEELEALCNLDSPDDVTLAVIKSILAAVGEVGADDWSHARAHINRELLERLVSLDPQQAWAEWQALCKAFTPLNELSASSLDAVSIAADEDATDPSTRASMALARWAASVRIVSAARAMQSLLEAKLQQANQALMKTFSGDGCHALNELRSYRVPPPLTFGVLQCVLMLSGNDEEDCRNWARMRTLCTQRLIKRLVTLRPVQVPRRVFKAVRRLVGDLVESEVKQESVATFSLYRWLSDFTRLASVA